VYYWQIEVRLAPRPQRKPKGSLFVSEKEKSIILWKASYQATHLLVNLFIGCFWNLSCIQPSLRGRRDRESCWVRRICHFWLSAGRLPTMGTPGGLFLCWRNNYYDVSSYCCDCCIKSSDLLHQWVPILHPVFPWTGWDKFCPPFQ